MPLPDVAVVLVSPRNPLNIGAVARAMSNFGFADLRIAAGHAPNIDSARSAVDAAPLLESARTFDTLKEAIADCHVVLGTTTGKARNLQQPMHDISGDVARHFSAGRTALLFGSEKYGLSSEDMSHCHTLLHIPTRAEHLSMNLGQAAAICCYAIATSGHAARSEPVELATSSQREHITEALLSTLARTGYGGAEDSAVTRQKTRRMVTNMNLTDEDSRLLLGMLRRLDGALLRNPR